MKDSAKFYKKHGYLEIDAKKYNRVLYLVLNALIEVPNKNLLRVTQRGLDDLMELNIEQRNQIFLTAEVLCNNCYDPPIETAMVLKRKSTRRRRRIRICQTYWLREESQNLKPDALPSSRLSSMASRLTPLLRSMRKILSDTFARIQAWLFSSGSTGPNKRDTE